MARFNPQRRQLLGAAALGFCLPFFTSNRAARAIGPSSKFRFGQLQLGSGNSWNPRPLALRRMAWEIEKRTAIDVELESAPVTLTSDLLHEYPFLYFTGDREFDLPSGPAIEALRRFLTFGGFILIDSAQVGSGSGFDASVRRLISAVFPSPAKQLEIVSTDHVIYKSFYLLDRPYGRVVTAPAMEAVLRDDRIVCAYVANDLAGAWTRDDFGIYEFPCEPDGERQRELSFRLGVNLVLYALCLDYKTDQVHVPFILKRRRWKPDDGAAPVTTPTPRRVPPATKK
jgi:hypothetical protein